MKYKALKFLIILVFSIGVVYTFNYFAKKQSKGQLQTTGTTLMVTNSTQDTVLTFLTVGADTNYITNVFGIFGITTNGMQGSFLLAPNDTLSYTSFGKGFSGNLCFTTAPVNCADTTLFPLGINIFEFALNNNFSFLNSPQETFDISCVSGVNSKIGVYVSGTNWNAGDTVGLQTYQNSYIYDNVGRHGVFPFGCDSCTVIVAPPVCPNHKPFSPTQRKSICNVQRLASLSGGNVIVTYEGKLNGEITLK